MPVEQASIVARRRRRMPLNHICAPSVGVVSSVDFRMAMILGRDVMEEQRLLEIDVTNPPVLLFSAVRLVCPVDTTIVWWLATPYSKENLKEIRDDLDISVDETRHLAFVLTPASIDGDVNILGMGEVW